MTTILDSVDKLNLAVTPPAEQLPAQHCTTSSPPYK